LKSPKPLPGIGSGPGGYWSVISQVVSAASTPSLRAQASNPGAEEKGWIASLQELLAMTEFTLVIYPDFVAP
jgi:hypothetical protein